MNKLLPTILSFVILSSCLSGPPTYVEVSNRQKDNNSARTSLHAARHDYAFPAMNIIEYEGFVVSYDDKHLIPFWSAYTLTSDEVLSSAAPAKGSFQQDSKVTFPQADYSDYKGSGWSRGHMAPAADFKWSTSAYLGTFVYTNCCPQNASLNNGSWNVLENKIRRWAEQYKELYIVTGPIITEGSERTIGTNGVAVPDAFFKAVLAHFGDEYFAIGFVMSNSSEKQSLLESCVSINKLEQMTGFDFFPFLDDSIEDDVEEMINRTFWQF